ncbi:hypothetical protein E0I56_005730 [Escherichia coli]|nr:hypothetical protein [Escherichia coli]
MAEPLSERLRCSSRRLPPPNMNRPLSGQGIARIRARMRLIALEPLSGAGFQLDNDVRNLLLDSRRFL